MVSFSQLKGKVVTLSNDSLCTSTLHFTSDSVAYYVTGCNDNQLFTKLNYKINDAGYVSFSKVPDSLYNPLLSLTRGDLTKIRIDSLSSLPRLIFLNKGSVLTESSWIVCEKNSRGRKTGTAFDSIPDSFFTDTSATIQFIDLFRLTQKWQKIHNTDFAGNGPAYIVNLDLPPLFGTGKHMYYKSDFFNISELHFRVIKGELHYWNTPEWIPVE
jgi:hypothetical protein